MMDLDNARRRGAPPIARSSDPEVVHAAPLDVEETGTSPIADPSSEVTWCIETINASNGSISIAACARSSWIGHAARETPPGDDLYGALAHGTHSSPVRVAIAGDVLLIVRCNERLDVLRVPISHALYMACASWAADNVHIAVAGGAVVVTVYPFTPLGCDAALDTVKRSTHDVLRRQRAFECVAGSDRRPAAAPLSGTVQSDQVVVTVHGTDMEEAGTPTSVTPQRSTRVRRRYSTDIVGNSDDSGGTPDSPVHAASIPGKRRRRRTLPGAPSNGLHVAQRYAYMLLFMLGTVSVAVLSVYIVFFGSLDFTLQTGIAFTRV